MVPVESFKPKSQRNAEPIARWNCRRVSVGPTWTQNEAVASRFWALTNCVGTGTVPVMMKRRLAPSGPLTIDSTDWRFSIVLESNRIGIGSNVGGLLVSVETSGA